MSPYEPGSKIEIPGLEAIMEYGDASTAKFDRIPGAYLINDRSKLDCTHLSNITGLQDDPDGRDSRSSKSDRHGEDAGSMLYGGRTIGLTGEVEAGNIPRVRDEWRRFKSPFGVGNRDLLVHAPSEQLALINELPNPSLDIDARTYDSPLSTSGVAVDPTGGIAEGSMLVGSVTVTGTTGAGSLMEWVDRFNINTGLAQIANWTGSDVFVAARVKVHAATGVVSSISVGVREWNLGTSLTPALIASQASPVTGTWYWLAIRVSASQIRPGVDAITPNLQLNYAGVGDYTLRFDRVMLVFLRPSDTSPVGYFDGNTPGFEWMGAAHSSRSIGPCYAVNRIQDPRFVDANSITNQLVTWLNASDVAATVNQAPTPSFSYSGSLVDRSVYFKVTKDATATSRILGVKAIDADEVSTRHPVVEGRTYKFACSVKALQIPATGTLVAAIEWYNMSGTLLSRTVGTTLLVGTTSTSASGVAPAGAVSALPVVLNAGTTTSSAVLELMITDPWFGETTYGDPGVFVGSSDPAIEAIVVGSTASSQRGARKVIIRPWLIKDVRKGPEGSKSPEQQPDGRYRRPFTMSLRASDPRIYQVDQRRRHLKLTGVSTFVVRQAPADFTVETPALPVPTGWTYEGNFITHPGTGQPYVWSNDMGAAGSKHPAGGIGVKAFVMSGSTAVHGTNRPTSDIKTRMYRSAEGFTYTTPKVILGGGPQGKGSLFSAPMFEARSMLGLSSGAPGSRVYYYDDLTVLLKRVAAGTWLEMRWNSYTHAIAPTEPNIPYAFEIWCSHTSAGVAGVTRLAFWEYASFNASSGLYPFDLDKDPIWLAAWMLNNTVFWELWKTYPSINTVGRIESGNFVLPGPVATLLGTTVAGQAGWSTKLTNADTQTNFNNLVDFPPFMHYYESSDASLPPVSVSCPVIGDVDTPQEIVLMGGLIDPIVSISVPAYDGKPAATSVARFSGTISDTDPITINVADPSVKDSSGRNQYQLVIPGSRFESFRPGVNYITVQAKNWGSFSEHVSATWRDARR